MQICEYKPMGGAQRVVCCAEEGRIIEGKGGGKEGVCDVTHKNT